MTYEGITHLTPMWLLPLKRRFFCPHGIHTFDEVWSMGNHYLSCDACNLIVHIKGGVDRQYVQDSRG